MPTILIIEDEYQHRKNLERLLKFQDFKVLVAEDGAQGLSLAKENIPDLIICDIMMPVMDGYECCEKILELIKNDQISPMSIVAATADVTVQNIERCRQCGFQETIYKPIDRSKLLQVLKKYIS